MSLTVVKRPFPALKGFRTSSWDEKRKGSNFVKQ
jgi:hypothetical protein